MQVMVERESRRQLSGHVKIDDAYLGAERPAEPGQHGRDRPARSHSLWRSPPWTTARRISRDLLYALHTEALLAGPAMLAG